MPRLYNDDAEKGKLLEVYPYYLEIVIDNHKVEVFSSEPISWGEAHPYVERAYFKKFKKYLREIALHFDGEYVDISYGCDRMPKFDRIRRITGYLVGTLDRFNDAKRAEESERVKHGVHNNN